MFDKLKQIAVDKYTKNGASKENSSTSITKFKTAEHGVVTALCLVAEKLAWKKFSINPFLRRLLKAYQEARCFVSLVY